MRIPTMSKDKLMNTIRNFVTLTQQVQTELGRIDPGLRDEVKHEREAAVWAKHGENLSAMLRTIRQGRDEFQARRAKESDPATALIRKAWQRADDFKPGMAMIADAFEHMEAQNILDFASEFNHPAMTLKALNVIRGRDLAPDEKKTLGGKIEALSGAFVDRAAVRECAGMELECLKAELEHMRAFSTDSAGKLTIGHEMAALEKLATQ
jgi:hypothetical protein